jgi:hypothetical protein
VGAAARRRAFPIWAVAVERLIAEGDLVAMRGTARATPFGPFDAGPQRVLPPTGVPLTLTQRAVVRVRAGRIVEAWVERDGLALLRQLGAPEAPEAPADGADGPARGHRHRPSRLPLRRAGGAALPPALGPAESTGRGRTGARERRRRPAPMMQCGRRA